MGGRTLFRRIDEKIFGERVARPKARTQAIDGRLIPAGMDHTEPVEFQKQREGLEPGDGLGQFLLLLLVLVQNGLMLLVVLVLVRAQPLTRLRGMGCVVADRIELMVAHDCQGVALFDHGPHDLNHAAVVRPSINEVADEHRLICRMPIDALNLVVAKDRQKLLQLFRLAVNISD